MKKFLLLFITVCLSFYGKAQDIHFSQFFNAPLIVSPSNTGNFDGDWRISSIYRSQWKQIDRPYLTQMIGYDQQVHLYNERFSLGGLIVNDKSGGNLNVFKGFLSAAYHKRIVRHNFHFGVQGGFVNKRIAPPEETFPNQFNWNSGQFDNGLASGETYLQDALSYGDFNVGIGYHYKTEKLMPFVHLALFHVNRPQETFFDSGNKLQSRKLFTGGVRIKITEKMDFEPSMVYMATTSVNESAAGGNVYYKLESNSVNKTSVFAGIFYRDGYSRNIDAYFLTGGILYKNFTVGLSYDRNISPLHTATSYRGAFEVSVIYQAINTRLKKIEIPCDRY